MSGPLHPRWRRVLFWTLFVYALLALFMIRYRWTLNRQRRMIEERLGNPAPAGGAPSAGPDESAKQMSGREVERQLDVVSREWAARPAEERRKALASRMEELSRMPPGQVDEMIEHVLDLVGVEPRVKKKVVLSEVDLQTAVPVNMREEAVAGTKPKVYIGLLDSEGNLSEIEVAKEELTLEELQALEAYRMMNQVPALQKLRPLLAPLLRRRVTGEK